MIATFEVHLRTPTSDSPGRLPKEVYVVDNRNEIDPPPGSEKVGEFQHPTYDHTGKIYHKIKDVLSSIGIQDMANVKINLSFFERVAFYELPEEMRICLDEEPVYIPIEKVPASASNSKPLFEVSDPEVVDVSPSGKLTPLKIGSTIVTVRASDNPILAYDVRVTVCESVFQDQKALEAA